MRNLLPASAALAVVATLALAGCSTAPEQSAGASPNSSPVSNATPATIAPHVRPTGISIPALDARSSLIPLGLEPSGEVEVPDVTSPMQAGWYCPPAPDGVDPGPDGCAAPLPGETGPTLILGHVDGQIDGRRGQPGIFYELKNLTPGDRVEIAREDGNIVVYTITRVDRVSKDEFPTEVVYGETERPEIRLITCGGVFDRSAGSYKDNIIAYGTIT